MAKGSLAVFHLAFEYDGCQTITVYIIDFSRNLQFYRSHIEDGSMGFSDAYFVLYSNEADLRERKESDPTRERREFEKHLNLIEPQKRLFTALNDVVPGYANLIEAKTVDDNVKSIIQFNKSLPKVERHSVELFDFMVMWMKQNAP